MKHRIQTLLLIVGVMLAALPALAQNTQIKGTLKGADGKPLAGVQVEMTNANSGQKLRLKTDKKGEFFSLGVTSGNYLITFTQDGKLIWKLENYPITLQKETNEINVDLAKETAAAQNEQKQQMTEEQKKQAAALEKENATIKDLNVMLQQANAAIEAGNPDAAIPILQHATQIDPGRALLWARYANANVISAKKDTDTA